MWLEWGIAGVRGVDDFVLENGLPSVGVWVLRDAHSPLANWVLVRHSVACALASSKITLWRGSR